MSYAPPDRSSGALFFAANGEDDAEADGAQAKPKKGSIASQRDVSRLLRKGLKEKSGNLLVEGSSQPEEQIQHPHCRTDDLRGDGVFELRVGRNPGRRKKTSRTLRQGVGQRAARLVGRRAEPIGGRKPQPRHIRRPYAFSPLYRRCNPECAAKDESYGPEGETVGCLLLSTTINVHEVGHGPQALHHRHGAKQEKGVSTQQPGIGLSEDDAEACQDDSGRPASADRVGS